jgi:hypothetical protein
MCLSGRCSLCINSEKETKMPTVDLTKPLTVAGWGDFHYIGKNQQGQLIVESTSGTIYRADPKTLKLSSPSQGSYYLTNKLEPWEEAFLSHTSFRSKFMTEEEYFKHVFELGRSWK